MFFVSEDGDDGDDGMSIGAAWKTLGHALKTIKPGQTVYLTEGVYEGGVTMTTKGSRKQKTHVRARGTDQVRIAGGLTIENSSGLTFERLQFDGTVSIKNSAGVNFDNCVFNAETTGVDGRSVDGLRVTQSLFIGTRDAGVSLSSCEGVFLGGNLFDNDSGVGIATDSLTAIEYSGHNGFSDATAVWRRDGEDLTLDSLAGDRELQSVAKPIAAVAVNGVVQVKNQRDFAARGPLSMWMGPHRYLRDREAVVTKPTVHSVSATTANIEWRSSFPGVFTVAWGKSPDASQHTARVFVENFGTYSVRGLKPDTTYSFRLVKTRTSTSIAEVDQARRFRLDEEPITFKTLKTDPEPKIYYVSPDGDNQNTGDSLDNAWKTVDHAAAQTRPGDTARIAEGIYPERFRVRATGTKDAPITFTPMKGAKVIFDSGGVLNGVCVVEYKDYINLDGLRFMAVQKSAKACFFGNTAIRARDANHLRVTRCMLDGRGLPYSGTFIAPSRWFLGGSRLWANNCGKA